MDVVLHEDQRTIGATFEALGSSASFEVVPDGRTAFSSLLADVRAVMDDVAAIFDLGDPGSELSAFRRGDVAEAEVSDVMRRVLDGCRLVEAMTDGAFRPRDASGGLDPSGFVTGWAIKRAANMLKDRGLENWCLSVGGDTQSEGLRGDESWQVTVPDPVTGAVAATLQVSGACVATSGTKAADHPEPEAAHVWNAAGVIHRTPGSMTVVGPSMDIADALATGCWAMGDEAFTVVDRIPAYHLLKATENGIEVSEGFPYLALAEPQPAQPQTQPTPVPS